MKEITTTPPTDKYVPNLPYFDPQSLPAGKPKLSPQNSGKRMMTKIGGIIKNKVRRNSLRRDGSSEKDRSKSDSNSPPVPHGHTTNPYPQSVLDELKVGDIDVAMNGSSGSDASNGMHPVNGMNGAKSANSSSGGSGSEVDRPEPNEVDFEEFLRQHPDLKKLQLTADQVVSSSTYLFVCVCPL